MSGDSTAPTPGQRVTLRLAVEERHLASALATAAGEAYPPLLSTPTMMAEMERACAALLRPALRSGEVSVGVRFDELTHLAPTPHGATLETSAVFERMEGAVFWFAVEATDAAGVVGQAKHARAVVAEERLLNRAAKRMQTGS